MPWAFLRVPASSANLGPGFDALGLALDIHLVCRFRPARELSIVACGCDADSIPGDASNLIWQTALRVAAHAGRTLPAVELDIVNNIPLGKGLGSSAAALTAGVVLADSLLELAWSRERILDEAARLEGHPDNVAACVLGGVVASAMGEDGHARAIRLELPAHCEIALIVPGFVLPTTKSRAALPENYSREDVVFNLQRTGLLVAALATGRTEFLRTALDDRLHQPFRAPLIPGLREVLALRAPGLYGCVLSGAGPSVLLFLEPGHRSICDLVDEILMRHGAPATILHTAVARDGYECYPTLP
jgi:homoserine kinase